MSRKLKQCSKISIWIMLTVEQPVKQGEVQNEEKKKNVKL